MSHQPFLDNRSNNSSSVNNQPNNGLSFQQVGPQSSQSHSSGISVEPAVVNTSKTTPIFVGSDHIVQGQLDYIASKFSPNLPRDAESSKLNEQATINLLCDSLNTPKTQNSIIPPACKIYATETYTEIIAYDPIYFKTHSFKAELVVDVTMSYPSTWAGRWWSSGGWRKTQREIEMNIIKQEKRAREYKSWLSYYPDVILSILLFILMICIIEVTVFEQPFIYLLIFIITIWWHQHAPFRPFSITSGLLLLFTIGWAFLRFSLKTGTCHNGHTIQHDSHSKHHVCPTHFMCVEKSCGTSNSTDTYKSPCNNSWEWSHCDKTDKIMIYAILFNLFIYLLLQLKHLGTFGIMNSTIAAPGCDAEGNGSIDRFKQSPRLIITIRYIDAGSLITKHSRLLSTKLHGTLETYEFLNQLIHDSSIQNRKIKLLSELSSIDTNNTNHSSWLQLYTSMIGHDKQHQEFWFSNIIPFHITFYEFLFSIFILIILIINFELLKSPLHALNINMHEFNHVVHIFSTIVFYIILIGFLFILSIIIAIMKK